MARLDWACVALLAMACAVVFAAAPGNGDFNWSESPRNALNGAFILDLLHDLPGDPVRWAEAYYLKYPALTILFYPPMLPAAIAVSYAALGVSHWAAMVCLGVFLFALAIATYLWARRLSSPPAALAAVLLLLAAPEILVWGQQVMLEVPMLAFATGGALMLARYGDSRRPWTLGLGALLLLCAIYTKQTAAFVSLGLALGLLAWQAPGLLRRGHVWGVAVLAAAALVPLAVMQVKFGSFNVTSVVNRADMDVPGRWSTAGLLWYAVRLPGMAGWPLVVLAAGSLAMVRGQARRLRGDLLLAGGWLAVTYVVLSLIALKEPRHGVPLLLPLALGAALALDRLMAWWPARAGVPLAAAAVLGVSVWFNSAVGLTGYREAADRVAALAPPGTRVAFAGNRDGAFIFNMRAQARQDIPVIRVDKLYLGINIIPELGLNPRDVPAAEIASQMNRYGISYVVTVPRIWAQAPAMDRFDQVLHSGQFEQVARIPVTGPTEERELVIYRNKGTLSDPPEQPSVQLPAAGLSIGG